MSLLFVQGALEDNAELLVLGATAVPWRLDYEVRRRWDQHPYDVIDIGCMKHLELDLTNSKCL